ncbi:MAG TPA: hypothetical protein VH092_29875 [Urbifossiella sp.]|jgi:hypothetical protein|nr:hypothetical protein [Urbifossiella sp.]
MSLTRTLCGLAALAATSAPAAAQLKVMPAPTSPNRIIYPPPPWITNAPKAGTAAAPAPAPLPLVPVDRLPEVNEVRPATASPPPALVPDPVPVRPSATQPLPLIPVLPTAAPATPPAAAGARPALTAAASPRQPSPATVAPTAPGRSAPGAVQPASRPDVWAPAASPVVPGTTLPPVPRDR